jgi:type I restriction-modification system DNA methylase subunit
MLDHLPREAWEPQKTFLDNSCGNGNFLIETYKRKVEHYQHDPLEALKTIYGVELMEDNTKECRHRLVEQAVYYGVHQLTAEKVVRRNIVHHDALTYDYEFEDPEPDPNVPTRIVKPKFEFGFGRKLSTT